MRDRLRLIRETEAFTLVEILVVLLLTGIVITVIYFMFITQNKSQHMENTGPFRIGMAIKILSGTLVLGDVGPGMEGAAGLGGPW